MCVSPLENFSIFSTIESLAVEWRKTLNGPRSYKFDMMSFDWKILFRHDNTPELISEETSTDMECCSLLHEFGVCVFLQFQRKFIGIFLQTSTSLWIFNNIAIAGYFTRNEIKFQTFYFFEKSFRPEWKREKYKKSLKLSCEKVLNYFRDLTNDSIFEMMMMMMRHTEKTDPISSTCWILEKHNDNEVCFVSYLIGSCKVKVGKYFKIMIEVRFKVPKPHHHRVVNFGAIRNR